MVACLALVVAPFLAVGPAQAQKLSWVDAAKDVWRVDMGEVEEAPTPAPKRTQADIRRVTVRHTDRAIVVRQSYVDLARKGAGLAVGGTIRTNTGLRRDFGIWAERGRWRGAAEMNGPRGPVDCAIGHQIDYDRNVTVVTIPRSCLKQPRWVKLQLGAISVAGSKQAAFYLDDARSDQADLSWTPRIRRG